MPWLKRISALDAALIAAAIVAAIALSPVGQGLAIVSLISVIGIPIYIVIVLIPTLFVLLLAVRLVVGVWRHARRAQWIQIAAYSVALLVMADFFVFRAWRVNAWLEGRAVELVAGDRNDLGSARPIGTLAVLRNTRNPGDNANECDDLCARLLLTGSVKQVLMLTSAPAAKAQSRAGDPPPPWPSLDPVLQQTGVAWRLETRDSCSNTGPQKVIRPVALPHRSGGPEANSVPAPSSEQLMRLRIASGICLEQRPLALGDADALFAYGVLHSGQSPFETGYDAWADTLSAWRVAFWRREAGNLSEKHRRTGVAIDIFPGVLIHGLIHGSELRSKAGWLRFTRLKNQPYSNQDPVFVDLLTEKLGLKLDLGAVADTNAENRDLRVEQSDAVDRILMTTRALSDVERQLIADYLRNVGTSILWPLTRKPSDTDAVRIRRIVQDDRIPLPQEVARAVQAAAGKPSLDEPAVAAALIRRLDALPVPPTESRARGSWNEQVRAVTDTLAVLPSTVVLPYRPQAVALTRDREKRMVANRFLQRLDLYGPEILPDILAMMDDAALLQQQPTSSAGDLQRFWTDVWRGGAFSLCRLGPQIPQALEDLKLRTKALAARGLRPTEHTVAAAMLRMGASDDDVRETLGVDQNNPEKMRSFGFLMHNARRAEACT